MSIETALQDLKRAIDDAQLEMKSRSDQALRDHGSDVVGTSSPDDLYVRFEIIRARLSHLESHLVAQTDFSMTIARELIKLRDSLTHRPESLTDLES